MERVDEFIPKSYEIKLKLQLTTAHSALGLIILSGGKKKSFHNDEISKEASSARLIGKE